MVNANYKFWCIDVGCNERIRDGKVFKNSTLYKALQKETLNILAVRVLDDGETRLPYVIVGDEAFPLQSNLINHILFEICQKIKGYSTIVLVEREVQSPDKAVERNPASNCIKPLKPENFGNCTNEGKNIREMFCTYFNNNGKLPWVDDYV